MLAGFVHWGMQDRLWWLQSRTHLNYRSGRLDGWETGQRLRDGKRQAVMTCWTDCPVPSTLKPSEARITRAEREPQLNVWTAAVALLCRCNNITIALTENILSQPILIRIIQTFIFYWIFAAIYSYIQKCGDVDKETRWSRYDLAPASLLMKHSYEFLLSK